jgi:hypothetical protein
MVWRDTALSAAANLGLGRELPKLSAEHWQKVLAAVETQMRLKGAELPANWRERLAREAGLMLLTSPSSRASALPLLALLPSPSWPSALSASQVSQPIPNCSAGLRPARR